MTMTELEKLLDDLQNEDSRQRLQGEPREKRFRSIDRDTAEFISVIARISKAKMILEIGTSIGYSTIWLGLIAKAMGGRVVSFEIEKWKYDEAVSNISKAGLSDFVEVIFGDPRQNRDVIPNNIDFVFLDAEKEDYVSHFETFFDKLKSGGIVIADNAVSHFTDLREYIEMVRNHNRCNSILISSIGKGLEITYKMNESELSVDWNNLVR